MKRTVLVFLNIMVYSHIFTPDGIATRLPKEESLQWTSQQTALAAPPKSHSDQRKELRCAENRVTSVFANLDPTVDRLNVVSMKRS